MSVGLSFKDAPKEVVRMKNTSGAGVVAGDILVLKAVATGDEVTTTTTGGDNQLLRGGGFMAIETIANNAYGRFLRKGFTTALKVDGTTDIAIGDRLTTFTSAGIAKKAAVGDPYFATALEAYITDDSLGVIDAILVEAGAEDPSAGASGGTPALTLGTANTAGVATTFIRDDDTILAFDATSPSTQAFGDAAAVGVATVAARRDHKHAMPSLTVIGPTFLTAADVTIANADTWYTGITLGSALTAGKTYLISGNITLTGTGGQLFSGRIYDSTNAVEIASASGFITTGTYYTFSFSIVYSGFTGTPTIVIDALSDTGASSSSIEKTARQGATNKATFIQAIQIT